MKKQLYKAIAVVVFAAAMSITSCNKDILDPLTGETVEEGLALTPGAILKDYPGKTLIVHFTYGSVIRERVDFTFEAEGPAQVRIYPADGFPKKENCAVRSTLTVQFNEDADAPVRVKLTATQAGNSQTKVFEFEPYYIKVNAQPIVLAADYGSTTKLEYSVNTNLDNAQLEAVMERTTYFTLENGIITTVRKNISGKDREGHITVREKNGNGILSAYIPITQKSLPRPDNLVDFKCEALKAALVERFDADYDGEVSTDEALVAEEIDIRGCGATDLTGISAFKKAWKLDARDNDIVDGTDIKGMRQLFWLDLKGNKNLATFDVSGCTQYFRHCEFELSDNLVYYTFIQQAGISIVSDPDCNHSRHVADTRETSDWSMQDSYNLIQKHSKGNGIPIVLSGLGYLDVDMLDGSFQRLIDDTVEALFKYSPLLKEYREYFDVYRMDHVLKNRDVFFFPDEEASLLNSKYVTERDAHYDEETAIYNGAYKHFYGSTEAKGGMFTLMVNCIPSIGTVFLGGDCFAFQNGYWDLFQPAGWNPVMKVTTRPRISLTDEGRFSGENSVDQILGYTYNAIIDTDGEEYNNVNIWEFSYDKLLIQPLVDEYILNRPGNSPKAVMRKPEKGKPNVFSLSDGGLQRNAVINE